MKNIIVYVLFFIIFSSGVGSLNGWSSGDGVGPDPGRLDVKVGIHQGQKEKLVSKIFTQHDTVQNFLLQLMRDHSVISMQEVEDMRNNVIPSEEELFKKVWDMHNQQLVHGRQHDLQLLVPLQKNLELLKGYLNEVVNAEGLVPWTDFVKYRKQVRSGSTRSRTGALLH